MLDLNNNYNILSKLYESHRSSVYKALFIPKNKPVILKVLRQEFSNIDQLIRYRREYEIINSLNSSRIIKAFDLQKHNYDLVLVLEDFGGQSLKSLLQYRRLTLEEFLQAAIKIVEGLADIHAARIVHKDINPSNIIYNSENKELKIIDFDIASPLQLGSLSAVPSQQLEGTLSYIAPEQTGRINRSIDYRTDFYSLGITFYEILTNQLPFDSNDPMELIHCHIAQKIIPVSEINPQTPLTVSNIISKLLAKSPEERYQSALGIKADLETCLEGLIDSGQIQLFPLGSQDIFEELRISPQLYGREQEINQILSAFERVSHNHTELILISGHSGIGKSTLVNEIRKVIASQQGYFINGKFEHLKQNIPYAAITQAFQNLMQQLLGESETQLIVWQEKILAALGHHGELIIDMVPNLEKIIGKQPRVEQLGASEAQSRFALFFKKFISVFSQKEHPLVFFLDDLQWSDISSLKLIELLLSDTNLKHLLIVGSYRDNEVNSDHALMQSLEKINKEGHRVSSISLHPLSLEQTQDFLCDSLRCSKPEAKPLAELALSKTNGNPFFITQLLQSLYRDELLLFDRSKKSWEWDIEKIRQVGVSDNVAALMIGKIEKLEQNTQDFLKFAACMGIEFNINILNLAHELPLIVIEEALAPAIQEGLISPLGNGFGQTLLSSSQLDISDIALSNLPTVVSYRFSHDGIHQAIYSLNSECEKKLIHLNIGRFLLRDTGANELDKKCFDIVSQLNRGLELIEEQSEKDELSKLNLIAGKKAKQSVDYESALKYLDLALKLLSKNSWNIKYKLTLEIYLETLEVFYLSGKLDRAEDIEKIVLESAKSIIDKLKLYELKILFYRSQMQLDRAIDGGLEFLNLIGLNLPKYPDSSDIITEEFRVKSLLRDIQVEELAELAPIQDKNKLATIDILAALISPAYSTNRNLYYLIVNKLLCLHIQYGNSDQACIAYVFYGNYLSETVGDFNLGYRFGQLSLKVLNDLNSNSQRSIVMHIYYAFIKHWKDEASKELHFLADAIKTGIEHGEIVYSNYAASSYCHHLFFFTGINLQTLEIEIEKYTNLFAKYNDKYGSDFFNYPKIVCRSLINNDIILSPKLEHYNDSEINAFIENQYYIFVFFGVFFKYMQFYIFKDYRNSLKYSDLCENYKDFGGGTILVPQHNFYRSLTLLSIAGDSHKDEQKKLLEKVSINQESMKKWVLHAPENYENKYNLIEAQRARILNKNSEAEEFYEQAIKGAKKSKFIHEEALAYERAAEFYLSLGREEFGQLYLRNAHYCYSQWGATAKVKQLEEEYPQYLLGVSELSQPGVLSTNTSTTGSGGKALDLNTIVKASQTISGEIGTEKLLQKLMKIVIENAGAQKGFLILETGGNWTIEAEGAVDVEDVRLLRSLPIDTIDPNRQTPLVSTSIVNYVARTQESIVLNDATAEGQFINDPYILAAQPKSVLCAPILNQGKLSGIVYLENNLTTGAFTADRLTVLSILSAQASISIENAQLYHNLEEKVEERTAELSRANAEILILNERLKAENMRMSAELEITRRLQQMLLPKPAELEAVPGVDIAGFMEPAEEVGGDYYDVLSQGDKATIGIGDVTGHGLESGVLTIVAQTAIRTLLTHSETDPVKFLQTVNQTLFDNVERMNSSKNMTLSLLEYQNKTLRLSGQHEEMIIVRSGGEVERIDTIDLGFPIGLEADITNFIASTEIALNAGDVVVLYTDGITEAFNGDNAEYGIERLIAVVVENRTHSAAEIKQAVIDDLRAYIGEQKVFDDITLVIIKQR